MAQSVHGQPFGKTEMWYVVSADKDAHLMSGLSAEITPEEYVSRVENNTITDVLCDYKVQSGDVFFLPAGRIHSIGKGCFIAEIQQTSDLTEPLSVDVKSKDSFMIVICLEGKGILKDSQENSINLKQGETILVPASTENVTFIPESKMKILTSWV